MTKRRGNLERMMWRPTCSHDAARLNVAAAAFLALMLGGCATGGVSSSAFVDPSRYDLYDCKQLITARDGANTRALELEGLIAKAETGVAGGLVSGLAYQSDYATARAQRDLIDQKLASNNCVAELAPPPLPPKPVTPAKRKRKKAN